MLAPPSPSPEAIFPASGYQVPQYTQIPDLLLDLQMAHMSGAELKVALYICRRTFGFKKNTDTISFNQMLDGIVTQDGRRLDFGTGLSRDALARAIKSLEEKRVILVLRSEDEKGSKQTNLYALNIGQSLAPSPEAKPPAPAPVAPPPAPLPTPPAPSRREVPPAPSAQEDAPGGGSPIIGLGGSTIFGLGGSPKNRLGGSPIIGLTINSSNNKQHNNKQNNNNHAPTVDAEELDATPPVTDVVVALQAIGLSARVAGQLATHYPEPRIREKLAFLAYLRAKDAVTHPAGWLRTAIVEDYARPDGFLTPDEHAARARAAEEQPSLFAYQLDAEPAAAVEPDPRPAARARHLQRLREVYGVEDQDRHFGEEVMDLLRNSSPAGGLLHALLPELEFLKLDGHQAHFAVATATALKQLQHPGTQTALRRTLRFLLRPTEPEIKQEEIHLEFCLMTEDPPAAPMPAEPPPTPPAEKPPGKPPGKRKVRQE